MSKCRLSAKGNPISSGIDVIVFSPPSTQTMHKISIETNPIQNSIAPPITISSREVVLDDHMMMYLIGDDYTTHAIREATCAQPSSEEVHVVQPLVG